MVQTFIYRARTRTGQLVKGTILSRDAYQAVQRLRARGYLVTALREKRQGLDILGLLSFYRRTSSKDLALFCRQLATMLGAGLSLVNALTILEKQHLNPHLRRAVSEVRGDLTCGSEMAEAMSRQPRIFPPVLVHMVAAGETGGVLDEVLLRMAEHFEKEHGLREKVKGALTYPAVITLVAVIAVSFLVTFVLPTLASLFTGSGLTLPWPTRALLTISGLTSRYGHWILAFAFLLLVGLARYVRTEGGRSLRDRVFLFLPIVGPILQKVAVARFCRTLGTLLRGGISLLPALEVVKNTADNQVIIRAIERTLAGIQKGQGMAAMLHATGIFPGMVVQMVRVGEESGSLDTMLVQIADYYEKEVDYAVNRLSSLFEPVLVLVVGGLVGFIVISIMLPLIDLVTVVG